MGKRNKRKTAMSMGWDDEDDKKKKDKKKGQKKKKDNQSADDRASNTRQGLREEKQEEKQKEKQEEKEEATQPLVPSMDSEEKEEPGVIFSFELTQVCLPLSSPSLHLSNPFFRQGFSKCFFSS